MAEPTDVVPQILLGIRADLRDLAERVDRNSERIDLLAQETTRGFTLIAGHLSAIHGRIDDTNERLGRMETHLHALHHVSVDRHVELERRLTRVEDHLGLRNE